MIMPFDKVLGQLHVRMCTNLIPRTSLAQVGNNEASIRMYMYSSVSLLTKEVSCVNSAVDLNAWHLLSCH